MWVWWFFFYSFPLLSNVRGSKHTNMCLSPFSMQIFENLSLRKSDGTTFSPFANPRQADSSIVTLVFTSYHILLSQMKIILYIFYDNFSFIYTSWQLVCKYLIAVLVKSNFFSYTAEHTLTHGIRYTQSGIGKNNRYIHVHVGVGTNGLIGKFD